MNGSMTSGSPVKLILRFSMPLLLGNLLQQAYNMIDSAIVGQILGVSALSSVGATSSVQFLVLGFCIGICAGFGVPVAKYFGAKHFGRLRICVTQAFLLTGLFAVILTAGTAFGCHGILHLMSIPKALYGGSYTYLLIIFLGIPFTLFYNLVASIMRALGDSRTPFIFLAVSAVLNIFLDLLFIAVIPMGVAGAALATILAQGVSGISCYIFARRRYEVFRFTRKDVKINPYAVRELLLMGVPMGLQYSITAIGTMVMQAANNGLGELYVSAFTAGSKIKQLAMCPFDAIATGVSVFCGQNLGAGQTKRIRSGIFTGVALGVGYGALIGLVLMFFGKVLVLMFVKPDETEVIRYAGKYLFCLGMFYWSLGILNICRMTIQGLGYSAVAIFSGFIEMAARILICINFVPKYSFQAICFTDQTAWVTAAIYCAVVCAVCVRIVSKKAKNGL